jgi:hypothetical protein
MRVRGCFVAPPRVGGQFATLRTERQSRLFFRRTKDQVSRYVRRISLTLFYLISTERGDAAASTLFLSIPGSADLIPD